MLLDPTACYQALKARDARFDGRFFVGVSSTRIYCRPVCTVKVPKRENCRFFPSAAAAESSGYRPCLRCRPELAPGNASVDATTRLAQAAASMMEDLTLEKDGLETLAARLGITDRHLRRAFGAEFGVSPVEFAQTQRLLLAKRLLTDTPLPVTEVAFASGFGSVRRFNALFKQRYRLRPSQLRGRLRGAAPAAAAIDALKFELSFRPPFDWSAVSAFLGARAIAGVEAVEDGSYRRTVRILNDGKEHPGWIAVAMSPRKPTRRVRWFRNGSPCDPRSAGDSRRGAHRCGPLRRDIRRSDRDPIRFAYNTVSNRDACRCSIAGTHREPRHARRACPHRGRARARCGGRTPRSHAERRHRGNARRVARAAGGGGMDRAIHCDARALLAGRVSS